VGPVGLSQVVAGAGEGAVGAGAVEVAADSVGSEAEAAFRAVEREESSDMARMTVDTFATRVGEALGARLVALVLYGSAARAQGAGSEEPQTMKHPPHRGSRRCRSVRSARRTGPGVGQGNHPPPLVFADQEWRDSADAFAIEHEDIREAHRVLAGRNPWTGISVRREDVRRQLEQELMGKLVHLRQAYVLDWNRPKRLPTSYAPPRFLTMLRAVLRLAGRTPPADAAALVRDAAALIGFASGELTERPRISTRWTRTAEYVTVWKGTLRERASIRSRSCSSARAQPAAGCG